MKKAFGTLTVATVLLFTMSVFAADRVVVVPMGGKKSTGTALAGDVLEGNTFSNKDAVDINGTMVNNRAVLFTPGTFDQTIQEGYHDGSGKVAGDADLREEYIIKGIEIFGVQGKATQLLCNVIQDGFCTPELTLGCVYDLDQCAQAWGYVDFADAWSICEFMSTPRACEARSNCFALRDTCDDIGVLLIGM